MFRQGDVLIFSTEKPESLGPEMPMATLGPVLALGEVTGHHHTVVAYPESYDPNQDLPDYDPVDCPHTLREWANNIMRDIAAESKLRADVASGPAARLYHLSTPAEDRLLHVSRHTLLRHEEHPAISLSPGYYTVRTQQEYLPEGWVRVAD
jgi:hypothetical protein